MISISQGLSEELIAAVEAELSKRRQKGPLGHIGGKKKCCVSFAQHNVIIVLTPAGIFFVLKAVKPKQLQ